MLDPMALHCCERYRARMTTLGTSRRPLSGRLVLWLVPAAAAITQVGVAMPGDAIVADNGQAAAGVTTTVILTWLAAERRRRGAWWVLVVFSVWSLAVSVVAMTINPGGALAVFLAGSAAALGCVLSRPVREYVDP